MAFNFQAYRNPYVGTIAELLSRGEDAKAKALIDVANAQAQAAQVRGQAWGGAIEGIGQTIAAIPGQIQAQKDQAFKNAQQARMVKTQQQDDAAEALANKMMSQRNVAGSVMGPLSDTMVSPAVSPPLASRSLIPQAPGAAGPSGWQEHPEVLGAPEVRTLPSRQSTMTVTNPSKRLAVGGVSGLDLWDIEALGQQFAAQGLGVQGQKYLELMRGSNADMEKHHASALEVVRRSAGRALQAGSYDMMLGSTKTLMRQLENNKVVGREDLAVFQQQLDGLNALPQDQKEAALQGLLRNISGVPEEEYTLNLGDVRYQGGKPIAANPRPLEKPAPDAASIQEYKFAVSQGYTGSFEQWSIDDANRRRPSGADQSETIGLRNDLLRQQIDEKKIKAEDLQKTKDLSKRAAEQAAQGTVDTVSNLLTIDPQTGNVTGLAPGTSNLFGARVPFLSSVGGTKTATVNAYLDQLTAERIVELIGEMKSQSRTGATGFGPLAVAELKVLQDASTVLSQRNISDDAALKELTKIYNIARKYNQPPLDNKELSGGITAVPELPPQLKTDEGVTFKNGPFAGQTWKLGSDGKPVKVS